MKLAHVMAATAASLLLLSGAANAAPDADAAQSLAKQEKCTKCHASDKKKDGPMYKETAEKYRGKPEAAEKLYKHLITGPTIKVDGKEEKHNVVKTKDEAAIKNLVAWILAH